MSDDEEEMEKLRQSSAYRKQQARMLRKAGGAPTTNIPTMPVKINATVENNKKRSFDSMQQEMIDNDKNMVENEQQIMGNKNEKNKTIIDNENSNQQINNDNDNDNHKDNDSDNDITNQNEISHLFPTSFGGGKKWAHQQLIETQQNNSRKKRKINDNNYKDNNNNNNDNNKDQKNDIANSQNDDRKFAKVYLRELQQKWRLPITLECKLKGHSKIVSSLSIDKSGTRLLTGSYDYTVRLYDFGGMKEDFQAFNEIKPQDGYPIMAIDYSPTGSHFLCVTGSCQPLIYDREGNKICDFIKGDMYLKDMNHTKGHTMNCTGGCWYPKNDSQIITWSKDSTIRLWDINNNKQCLSVIKTRSKTGNYKISLFF